LAQGTALKGEIREMARFLREEILGKAVPGAETQARLLSTAWKFEGFLAPRYREELRGMADATGVPIWNRGPRGDPTKDSWNLALSDGGGNMIGRINSFLIKIILCNIL